MLMKNNIAALWILGSIASPTTIASNLRGGNVARMNYPVELNPDADADAGDRKLYQYSYYWTQTGNSNRFFHGNFDQDAPEGWVRHEDWIEDPPAGAGWMEGEWGEDGSPDSWWSDSRDFGPDGPKLELPYSYSYWTQTGNNNRYFRGNFEGDAPEGWVRQDDWIDGPPANGAEWVKGTWGLDGPPGSWDSWSPSEDGP